MPNPEPGKTPSASSSGMNDYALLALLVVGCLVLGLFIMVRLKRPPAREASSEAPAAPPVQSPAPRAEPARKDPGLGMPSPGGAPKQPAEPAASPGNLLPSGGLSMPERPHQVAGFFSPEDSASGAGPGGAGVPPSSVESVVRGKKMYVIDVTGWGVAAPQGFVPEEGAHGTWKPASGDKAGSRILVRSGPACAPSCANQAVSDSAVTRSITGYRRSYTFRCPWVVKYGGDEWKYADITIIKLEGETCVTMTLLSRSTQSRDQATSAFHRMRDSIQPLPQKDQQPTLDGKIEETQVPLLR